MNFVYQQINSLGMVWAILWQFTFENYDVYSETVWEIVIYRKWKKKQPNNVKKGINLKGQFNNMLFVLLKRWNYMIERQIAERMNEYLSQLKDFPIWWAIHFEYAFTPFSTVCHSIEPDAWITWNECLALLLIAYSVHNLAINDIKHLHLNTILYSLQCINW